MFSLFFSRNSQDFSEQLLPWSKPSDRLKHWAENLWLSGAYMEICVTIPQYSRIGADMHTILVCKTIKTAVSFLFYNLYTTNIADFWPIFCHSKSSVVITWERRSSFIICTTHIAKILMNVITNQTTLETRKLHTECVYFELTPTKTKMNMIFSCSEYVCFGILFTVVSNE